MDENRARHLVDVLGERGTAAHPARRAAAAPRVPPSLPVDGGVFRRFLGGFRQGNG